MWQTTPRSHREVLAKHAANYDAGIANGTIVPLTYPIATLGAGVGLLFFLCIPPRSRFHNTFTRYAVFAFIACWHAYYIRRSSSPNMTTGFGIGILSAWGTLWSAVLLIFRDQKALAKRIDCVSPRGPKATHQRQLSVQKERASTSYESSVSNQIETTHKRTGKGQKNNLSQSPNDSSEKESKQPNAVQSAKEYYWQYYPVSPFYDRLEWVLDIWTNFRGMGWDFKISGLPTAPLEVEKQLSPSKEPQDHAVSRAGIWRLDSYWFLMRRHVRLWTTGYLIIDLLITMTHYDPYFWGIMDSPPPSYLPTWVQHSAVLLRGYRLTIAMSIIWLGLRCIFSFAPLLFVGLMGPKYIGVQGEPWLYPDHYGTYWNVFDRGLAGWWGGWWHQTFRYAFQAAGEWILSITGVDVTSIPGKAVMLFTAFSFSGILHACGSTTQPGETNPWGGPFMFFFLQAFGIMAEMLWGIFMKRTGLSQRTPQWLKRLTNFVWVHLWFLATGPLLVNDMAKGGLWLIEPVMLSPIRYLGFGVEGDGLYCWGGRFAKWHSDPNWLWSGIAL